MVIITKTVKQKILRFFDREISASIVGWGLMKENIDAGLGSPKFSIHVAYVAKFMHQKCGYFPSS